jgi:hypothetical protein
MHGWAKLPRALTLALARRELDTDEFALVAFVIAAADYRTQDYVATAPEIAEMTGWRYCPDYLVRRLRRLRDAEWLDFDSSPGKRAPYVIRPGRRVRDAIAGTTERGRGSRSAKPRKRSAAAIPPRSPGTTSPRGWPS